MFVAIAEGQVVGYLIYGTLWSILHLDDVFIMKRFRRMGLGSALVARLVRDAKVRGFRKIMSDIDYDNEVSRRFHQKNGFREAGRITSLWAKKDSIVFSRDMH